MTEQAEYEYSPSRGRRVNRPMPKVEEIDRDEFIHERWDYQPGEHVTILGPNKRGKSTLGFQLLQVSATKEMNAYVLWSKPRDADLIALAKKSHFQISPVYPPDKKLFKPAKVYVIQPPQTMRDLKRDKAVLQSTFRETMMDCYASKQPRIVFLDEAQEIQANLKLKEECEAIWKRGRTSPCGQWALAQRSAYNSQDMYNAPEHLILFNDPDKRNRERFSEIGGVDPDIVTDTVYNLKPFQAMYLKRTGPGGRPCLCVINP